MKSSNKASRSQTELWLSGVPEHWTVKKLGFLASLKSGDSITSEEIHETGTYPVYGGGGLRGYTDSFTHRGYHVLIGRQGALCGNINYANGEFWASEHAIVVTPREECDVRWLGELLRSANLNQYSVSAAQPGLSVDTISALKVPIPPIAEQKAIALFLEAETSQIDRLLAEKQQMLLLMAEKHEALASQVVTRGVNADKRTKPSGLAWLATVPAQWGVRRGKLLFCEIDEESETGEETLLSLRMQRGLVPHNDVSEKPIPAENLIGYKIARPGEIVLNRMRAASGLVAVTPQHGIVSPDYAVFRALDGVDPEYFTLLFKTPLMQAVFRSLSKGLGTGESGFLRLYSEDFLAIKLPVPPIPEQKAIVAELARERARAATVENALEDSIKLLKERRAALISAAVTGQLTPKEMSV